MGGEGRSFVFRAYFEHVRSVLFPIIIAPVNVNCNLRILCYRPCAFEAAFVNSGEKKRKKKSREKGKKKVIGKYAPLNICRPVPDMYFVFRSLRARSYLIADFMKTIKGHVRRIKNWIESTKHRESFCPSWNDRPVRSNETFDFGD